MQALLVGLAASLLIVLVALPRFGAHAEPGNDSTYEHVTPDGRALEGLTIDMREYLRLTEYYADEGPAPQIAPFTARLGAPFLAGQLPVDSSVGLPLVNLVLLCAGLFALLAAQVALGVRLGPMVLSAVLFAVSFPVFYWSSFNYVAGAVVGALSVGVLLMTVRRFGWALLVLALSMFLKEWALVGLVALVAWVWFGESGRRRWAMSAGAVAAAAAGGIVSRLLAPTATEFYNPWIPTPAEIADYISWNLSRVGPIGQVAFTAVPLLVACVIAWRNRADLLDNVPVRMVAALVAGTVAAVGLSGWAFLAAQWDGRSIWMAYPYALTLMALSMARSGDDEVPAVATGEDTVPVEDAAEPR